MRSFDSLALRQVRARRLRALLTAAGIVLGVGMILGVLLLAATINRTFDDLFDSVYGGADLVVSGSTGGNESLPAKDLKRVERTAGGRAGGRQRPQHLHHGRGERPSLRRRRRAAQRRRPAPRGRRDQRRRDGRRTRGRGSGLEIAIQESWADANDVKVGDELELATPDGVKELRRRRPLPVLDRARLRRPGVRGDAAGEGARRDGQGEVGRRDRRRRRRRCGPAGGRGAS